MKLFRKSVFQDIIDWIGVLWIFVTPFVVLVSSVLSTINWYSVGSSVVQGILGFIVGGSAAALSMGVGLVVLLAVKYALD